MPIHVIFHLPPEEVALDATLSRVPDLSLVCKRIVASPEVTISPLVYFRGTDLDTLEPALAADPTVEEFAVLAHTSKETVSLLGWSYRVRLLARLLTMGEAFLLTATATADRWTFQLLVPRRAVLSQLVECCTVRNLSLEVTCIETCNNTADLIGLTPKQYEALATASARGYFAVPREIMLEELATELGISHQALSERLRRAHNTLLHAVLQPPRTDTESASPAERSDDSLHSLPMT